MADFKMFNEGKTELAQNGLPSTCYFLLSTDDVDTHSASETLVGAALNEITGTGYARQSQSEPTPVSGVVTFAQMTWTTGVATNWPASVKSIVLVTTANNTGKAICAWNLQTGGTARDLSGANTTERVTPVLNVG